MWTAGYMNIDVSNAHCGPWIFFLDHTWLRVGYYIYPGIRVLTYFRFSPLSLVTQFHDCVCGCMVLVRKTVCELRRFEFIFELASREIHTILLWVCPYACPFLVSTHGKLRVCVCVCVQRQIANLRTHIPSVCACGVKCGERHRFWFFSTSCRNSLISDRPH